MGLRLLSVGGLLVVYYKPHALSRKEKKSEVDGGL